MGIADWTFDVAWSLKLLAHLFHRLFSLHVSALKIPHEGFFLLYVFAHSFFWSYRGVREVGGASLVG
jgi:hypothetical protein